MSISDAEFADWLDDPTAQRVTLYDFTAITSGGTKIRRFSNRPYAGGGSANPYLAVVAQGLEITESISMVGNASLTAGAVTIENDGEFDSFYEDIWLNLWAELRVGDVRWPLEDFRLMYVGVQGDIAPSESDNLIRFQFRDIFQYLNAPVSEVKLTGDVLCPVSLGEVPNMSPKYDRVTDRWNYHTGPSEGLIRVRTDGKRRLPPNEIIDYPLEGNFKFVGAVGPGAVTCSVQGDKNGGTYRNTISALIQHLVTSFGKADTRLTTSDLDAANLAEFASANPQPVGLAILDRTNVLTACAKLAASKGAQMIPSRLGKVRLIQFAIPTTATADIPVSMQVDDNEGRIVLVNRTTPRAVVKIGYCRNYTVQPNLQTSLPPTHKQIFAQEWRTYTTPPAADVKANYKLSGDVDLEETCLLDPVDAQVEGLRRQNIVKVPRHTYRVGLHAPALLFTLGQAVRLFGTRYNLSAGKIGLITSLKVNFDTYRTIAEVTI